jgi:uncharacterized membrane protein YfcA
MGAAGLELAAVTLLAAIVNGALGYGFSSVTVPLALLFTTNRALNPALVLLEVVLNLWLVLANRRRVPAVARRLAPVITGLAPGIAVGTLLVACVNPTWIRFGTFLVLLPVTLLQVAGFKRPIRAERTVGLGFGGALGVLYSMTTVSGPPGAAARRKQELSKDGFSPARGLIRFAE